MNFIWEEAEKRRDLGNNVAPSLLAHSEIPSSSRNIPATGVFSWGSNARMFSRRVVKGAHNITKGTFSLFHAYIKGKRVGIPYARLREIGKYLREWYSRARTTLGGATEQHVDVTRYPECEDTPGC